MDISGKRNILNISQVIEERTNKKFAVNLIAWTFLLMLLEGFDVSSISFIASILMEDWNIDSASFGYVFGAGTVGLMIGGFLFGYIGDKLGRKKTIMISTAMFAVFTLLTVFANSLFVLILLRFLVGLGLGGTVPLCIVLVNEYAPKTAKGRWVAIMFTGFPLGMSAGGMISAWLLSNFDWHSIFIVGGIAPLLALAGIYWKLPESLRFLVNKNKSRTEITKLVLTLKPDTKITQNTEFTVDVIDKEIVFTPKMLFAKNLKFVTPLIWAASIISSFVVYFMNSWMPKLLVSSGLSLTDAAFTTSLYHLAGLLGGPAVGWLIDRYGLLACVLFPLFGSILTAVLGFPITGVLLMISVFCAGFFVIGTQGIMTASTPMFYPTAYRAKGNGIAMGIAKIGSITGPIIGGILMAQLTLNQLFFVNSGIIAGAVIIFLALAVFSTKIFAERKSEDEAVELEASS